MVRYHSLMVQAGSLPPDWQLLAWSSHPSPQQVSWCSRDTGAL